MYWLTRRERSTQYKSLSDSDARATPSVRNSARDCPDNNTRPPGDTPAFAVCFAMPGERRDARTRAALARRAGWTTASEDSLAGTSLRVEVVVIMNRCHCDTRSKPAAPSAIQTTPTCAPRVIAGCTGAQRCPPERRPWDHSTSIRRHPDKDEFHLVPDQDLRRVRRRALPSRSRGRGVQEFGCRTL